MTTYFTLNNDIFLFYYLDSTSIGNAYFGPGTGAINMDNVFCTGTENALTDCSYSATHNCVHGEDASVVCIQRPGKC